LCTECRLGDVATVRCFVKPKRLGHRDDVLELAERKVLGTGPGD
jgi:hypothetical protein